MIDSSGFLIADRYRGSAGLASDDLGNVALIHDGQHFRLIEDVVPLLDDSWPEEDEPYEPDTTAVTRIRIGQAAPNPSIGSVALDIDLPVGSIAEVAVYDLTGRRLLTRSIAGPQRGAGMVWDGRLPSGDPAPAGVYLLHVSAGGRKVIRKVEILH